MDYLRVVNWENFQHYKDRSPPWIKLHCSQVLDEHSFACLQDASKMHLIGIWVLASRLENRIPADPEFIRNRINATEPVNLKLLIQKGFLECDSGTQAECLQEASEALERGEERRGETEQREENSLSGRNSLLAEFTAVFNRCYGRRVKPPSLSPRTGGKQFKELSKVRGRALLCLPILAAAYDHSKENRVERRRSRKISDLFHDGSHDTFNWASCYDMADTLPIHDQLWLIADEFGLAGELVELGAEREVSHG